MCEDVLMAGKHHKAPTPLQRRNTEISVFTGLVQPVARGAHFSPIYQPETSHIRERHSIGKGRAADDIQYQVKFIDTQQNSNRLACVGGRFPVGKHPKNNWSVQFSYRMWLIHQDNTATTIKDFIRGKLLGQNILQIGKNVPDFRGIQSCAFTYFFFECCRDFSTPVFRRTH